MKTKTINAVLTKKFNEFVSTITDDVLRNDVKNGSIITGGCITSMLLREPVNDYDIYFINHDLAKRVANYYVNWFNTNQSPKVPLSVRDEGGRIKIYAKSAGVISENEKGVYQYFETLQDAQNYQIQEYVDTVISDQEPKSDGKEKPFYRPVFMSMNAITLADKIQLIVRFTGKPEEIHDNYDFIHCMNYWTSWNRKLELNQKALESILTKELMYVVRDCLINGT